MHEPYAFIGGVDVSRACLEAAAQDGKVPALVVGYDETKASASGYVDLGPLCREIGSPLLRTSDVNGPEVVRELERVHPEVIFIVGWSQLVRAPILGIPRHGCVGIHPTPLPIGRGRAPIPWTILRGCRRTASTMFFLTEGIDDGDIIGRVSVDVAAREDATSLYEKHRAAHVTLVRRHLGALLSGTAPREPQDERRATYWEGRRPEDGRIPQQATVLEADRLVRAVTHPFPGAFVPHDGGTLTIWRAEPAEEPAGRGPAGEVTRDEDGAQLLWCVDGALRILAAEPA